ncbi:probable RNA-binding protein EIF1AD [Microplitis demolitor]|uniref:probable RNA-binding protein EIF1AD n=1 Tax=Microplitis demolitor TaxID=69319 RepID=UPI0004CC9323|nr:probable RNA-binding protein EIF1AD [Microplitis demolitor]
MSKVTKRKHVTKLQEDFSIPLESQSIVQLVEPRGNNLHEVSDSTGERFLVSMPSIFRNNVYVKRGDFVLVESIPEGDKVKAEIIKVLTEEHIKYYRSQSVWPKEFDKTEAKEKEPHPVNKSNNDSDNEDDLFINTNRNNQYTNIDSSTSDSDD